MKKFIAIFSFILVGSFAMAQGPVKFESITHSFGKLNHNKPATFDFSFKNTSNKAVIVDVATAECGCTTPEYPKAPIAKGKTGVIKVTYNAANLGTFTKKVTVKFANVEQPVILTIEGEVVETK